MPARLHPGVYVEEVPSGARAIEAAGTSTAIFVGQTERGPLEPTMIKGVADYERTFGGYRRRQGGSFERVVLRYSVEAFFANGGSSAYVLRALAPADAGVAKAADTGNVAKLQASSPGKWGNSVSVAFGPSSAEGRFRIYVGYTAPGESGPQLVERWDKLTFDPSDENYVADVLQRSLYLRWEEGAALPAANAPVAWDGAPALGASATDLEAVKALRALGGGAGGDATLLASEFKPLLRALDGVTDASLLVVPSRFGEADDKVQELQNYALDYAEGRPRQDLFCVADMPRHASSVTATQATSDTVDAFKAYTKTDLGAVYYPWLEIADPVGAGRDPTVMIGPSAFVAGLYARTDQRRGVWKAPAGLEATLLGVRRLEYKLLDAHQDDLNPLGVNALRSMPQGGNVVWGARTQRPASEWRYVPVRRMAIFLRTSIYNGIQWAVFEPNDEPLWSNLRLTISGFMDQLHRQGAFAGQTSREAYFVKCDAETTPEADRIAGIVNVWVGFAPLRPAEFVVVKLSQIVNQKA